MKHILRFGFWVVLTIACVLLFLRPAASQPPAIPPLSRPVLDSPLSALQFDPQQFQTTLDRGDVAGAVQQLEVGWKQQFDQYYEQTLRSKLLTPNQIAQSLSRIQTVTGTRSALIYAISIPGELEVILLLPNGELVHHRVTLPSPEALTDVSRSFRSGLVNLVSPEPEYLPAAQQLYQWIIQPLEPALQQQRISHLLFCLGGGLRSLPMAALHDGQRFLVEQYGVSVIPAFNLLDQNPARLQGTRVLAMGASEFQDQQPLPAVPVELAAIAQIWQGEVLLNDRFTVAQLRQQRDSYPFGIVHLATHAAFTPGVVQNSFIQFWDQSLTLDELGELDLRQPIVQLLVLSACRTAMGDPNAELGFAGLAVQSGAKAALATLWSISDAATVVVMSNFYENLKTAPTKVEALRQTQAAMLRQRLSLNSPSIQRTLRGVELPETVTDLVDVDLSHPYYWAGFTLIGNPW